MAAFGDGARAKNGSQKSLLPTVEANDVFNTAFETTPTQECRPRHAFNANFGAQDQKECMREFSEKRATTLTYS